MQTPVKEDQFEVSDRGIRHVPTDYEFAPHSGSPFSGNIRMANHGNKLPNGDDYSPLEVERMMRKLWSNYVKERGLVQVK